MHSIAKLDNVTPRVFGHLYIAVFSNGTVKAGRSATDPKGRVTAHVNSGKAFDIRLDSAFYSAIYTNDTSAREKLMHQEIGLLATLTAGKEWFKFDGVDAAVNFASAYLCKVERMSFSERPSIEQLMAQEKATQEMLASSNGALMNLFQFNDQPSRYALVSPSEGDLEKMEQMLLGRSLETVVALAHKLTDHEDYLAQISDDFDSGLSVLVEAMNCSWDEALSRLDDPNDFHSRCKAIESMSFESAVRIIKAAASYPGFFCEALSTKWEAA